MVEDVMQNVRVIEGLRIENQFEAILAQLKSVANLEIKPLSFYKQLSFSLKKSALSLQEINDHLTHFLQNGIMPNSVILSQLMKQLLSLKQYKLAYSVYQFALQLKLADKYVFSDILCGLSKMPVTNEQLILKILEHAQDNLDELNEYHISYAINALANAQGGDFKHVQKLFHQAQSQSKVNHHVYLSYLNAIESYPSLDFGFIYDLWCSFKAQNLYHNASLYNQFLYLFNKFKDVDAGIFEEVLDTANNYHSANYTSHLRAFLGLIENSDAPQKLFNFYQLFKNKYNLQFWLHQRLFAALRKFSSISSQTLLQYLSLEKIQEPEHKSQFYIELLTLLGCSQDLSFHDVFKVYSEAILIIPKTPQLYSLFFEACIKSQQVNLESVYEVYLDSLASGCREQDLLQKTLNIINLDSKGLNLLKFGKFIKIVSEQADLFNPQLVNILDILEKNPNREQAIEMAMFFYKKIQPTERTDRLKGSMLNFFMYQSLTRNQSSFLQSIKPQLVAKKQPIANSVSLTFEGLSCGEIYFGMLDFLSKSYAANHEPCLISIQHSTPFQLLVLNKVLLKMCHLINQEKGLETRDDSVEFIVKTFYNKDSAFSPFVSKK